jgi:murein DD-endopeptidase MepM/ murein hydrolase activator NlpD
LLVAPGLGLLSLYAHLPSLDGAVAHPVQMGGHRGLRGAPGRAGGEHLHFPLLLGGIAVTPIDWWSNQWVEDRVLRKLQEAAPTRPGPG